MMVISSMSLSGVEGRWGLLGVFFLNILLLSLSGPVGRLTGGILGGAGGVLTPETKSIKKNIKQGITTLYTI